MNKGLNLKTIKSSNRTALLYLLNEKGSLSRKEIASELGLTQAAVTKISANLLEEGVIYEKEAIGKGVGRKEIKLSLRYDDLKAFGVNFERDYISFSISTLEGELIEIKNIEFNDNFSLVKEKISEYYSLVKTKYHILGAGISIIGRDNKYGIWPSIDLTKELESIIDVPLIIKNNVVAFSTANVIYSNIDDKNVLLFKWGPGVGSSFIRDGKVLSGDDHGVAEIGHMIVNPFGKKCRCGKVGCLETETALDVILNEARKYNPSISLEEVFNSDDSFIRQIIDNKISIVCLALLNASTLLNANRIILFGSVFKYQKVLDRFFEVWDQVSNSISNKTIYVSPINDKTSYIGCTSLVVRKLFFEKVI